jgi:hypothetical protein
MAECGCDKPECYDAGICAADTPPAAALRSLAAERDALRQDRDGLDALVKRMHEQDVLAIKAWQAAHPGFELTWPSCARLSAWCMGEVANVTAERDALKAENARLREALREIERSHIPDQPAAFEYSDLDWARLHVGKLRSIARVALGEKE